MRTRISRGGRGFTLIELLVVVAIIGLLISILLPSLSSARRTAREVKCLFNLKTINQAAHQYYAENNDWFPFEIREKPTPTFLLTSFGYGGHPGKRDPDSFFTLGLYSFRNKPLNPMIFPDLPNEIEPPFQPLEQRNIELREKFTMFKCPDDKGLNVNSSGQPDEQFKTSFDLVGTSYGINYHWIWLWAAGSGSQGPPWQPYSRPKIDGYLGRANSFLNKMRSFDASRFVLLNPDLFDNTQWRTKNQVSWHMRQNTWNFMFLDGHAAATFADVSDGEFYGGDWLTAGGEWYNDENNPLYSFRDLE